MIKVTFMVKIDFRKWSQAYIYVKAIKGKTKHKTVFILENGKRYLIETANILSIENE